MHSIPEILKCVEICNRLGMDVISCSAAIAFLVECCQENLVKNADIGFSPGWGDYRSIVKLMHMIAFKEGIGEVLAGGVKRASKQIPGSEPFALHVRGVEMSCRDPRAKPDVWALGYLTNTRGGDHLRARSPVELLTAGLIDGETEELGASREEIERLDMPSQLKAQIFGSPPPGQHSADDQVCRRSDYDHKFRRLLHTPSRAQIPGTGFLRPGFELRYRK